MKKGTRVTLREDSEWNFRDESGSNNDNPIGVEGTVQELPMHFILPVKVKWDNGTHNSYRSCDLDIVK